MVVYSRIMTPTPYNKAKGMLMTAQVIHPSNTAKAEAIKQAESVRELAPIHLKNYWDEVLKELFLLN